MTHPDAKQKTTTRLLMSQTINLIVNLVHNFTAIVILEFFTHFVTVTSRILVCVI